MNPVLIQAIFCDQYQNEGWIEMKTPQQGDFPCLNSVGSSEHGYFSYHSFCSPMFSKII